MPAEIAQYLAAKNVLKDMTAKLYPLLPDAKNVSKVLTLSMETAMLIKHVPQMNTLPLFPL